MFKSVREIRYIVERNTMPSILYPKDEIEKTKKILQLIENGRGKMMWVIYSGEYKLYHRKCPYAENQFSVNIEVMSPIGMPKYTMVIADLPKPEAIAFCSKMIICYCANYENIRYYVVEKAFDGKNFMLCGWDEQHNHINYGDAPTNDDDLKRAVNDIYIDYLRKFFIAYKAELNPIKLQSITDAVRTASYLICDAVSESSLLKKIKLVDNYVDQTAMLLLELAVIHNQSDSLLENALLDQLPSLTSNSLTMTDKNETMGIYADVYTGKHEPRGFWMSGNKKPRSAIDRVIIAFGDLLVYPECVYSYYSCKQPLLPKDGLEEFHEILVTDVKEQLEKYLQLIR